jgi:hypothetical protein
VCALPPLFQDNSTILYIPIRFYWINGEFRRARPEEGVRSRTFHIMQISRHLSILLPLGVIFASCCYPSWSSWSWISVDGKVFNPHVDEIKNAHTKCFVTLDPRVEYADKQNPFGNVVSADLNATVVIAKVILELQHTRAEFSDEDKAFMWLHRTVLGESRKLTRSFVDLDVLIGSREDKQKMYSFVYCLFVFRINSSDNSNRMLHGLVLDKFANRRRLYHRIGKFFVRQPDCDGLLEEITSKSCLAEDENLESTEMGCIQLLSNDDNSYLIILYLKNVKLTSS